MSTHKRPHDGEETQELRDDGAARPVVVALWDGGSVEVPLSTRGPTVIGRGANSDVVIEHPSISRRHVELRVGPDLSVVDLGSANGTRVRGEPIAPNEPVKVGWREPFEIGRVVVTVRPPWTTSERRNQASRDESGMRDVEQMCDLVAPTDISVLLFGETGAGKGYLAHRIHERSKRAKGPWLHLNCAALPEHLLESELFGYERGAFTGATQSKPGLLESATGGTVFLDEVGEIPPSVQAKLLIALERREVLRIGALRPRAFDVRFVSATNRDVEADERLRPDLYYRLAGLPIHVPPLRERRGEIPGLTARFVAESAKRLGRPEPAIGAEAMKALVAYDWPGNVRELATVVERALLFGKDRIDAEHLVLGRRPQSISPPSRPEVPRPAPSDVPPPPPSRRTLAEDVGEMERRRITDALEQCGGNQSRAAEMLGISRRTLINRMIAFSMPRPRKG
jgi:transcriptional regulator with PAS, ATPase and Fis domain